MKYIESYGEWNKIFENLDNPIGIQEFIENIGIHPTNRDSVIEWWQRNRQHIQIHYFRFACSEPIMGVFLGENEVAINSKIAASGWMKLFLALHESRHADQHQQGVLMPGYWDTVVAEDEETFLAAYQYFEQDANDFALDSMVAMGFEQEIRQAEPRLRGNERAGRTVYQMMKRDIQKFNPVDLIDLFKIQIL